MYIDAQTIITAGAVAGAIITLGGVLVSIVKWVLTQKYDKKKQEGDLAALQKLHVEDMKRIRQKEDTEIKEIKDELCMLSYCMLATLDGLKQLNCNGNVTDAYNRLSKHINKQAHQ